MARSIKKGPFVDLHLLEKTEKALIEKALEKTAGNQTRAAKELGISRVWLRKKMEKYGLFKKLTNGG